VDLLMRHAVLVFYSALLLGGCQQMAWKPGAGASDLKSDTAICRAQVADEEAVPECLQRRGWVLRQRSKESGQEKIDGAEAALAADADAAPTPLTNTPSSSATLPASTGAAPISNTAPQPRNKPVPSKKPVAIDPLAKQMRQSWWKAGAQAGDLAADQADCLGKLGAAHQPDSQKRLYTRGMIDCLKAQGWSGY
jgi:hypothetical protein